MKNYKVLDKKPIQMPSKRGLIENHLYNYHCQALACPHDKIFVAYTARNGDKINITTLTQVHVKQNVKGHSKK